ncbi:propanol dehydrogenase PduQ [Enterococcus sp. AZ194]|uniref:1-propanol dehydrogenase PduQ n=1 Tax=Enterococcus sp. AZ194 TaxID=2774629 RepID=UPI003F203A28
MEKIHFPTQLWVGEDALANLAVLKGKKVFIVTDPFMVESGLVNQVTTHLEDSEIQIFSDIIPDPPVDKIVSGIKQMAEFGGNTIVAIGGGSAIDAAKAMKFFGKKTMNLDIEQFIAIPTTSGTGSEVTNFSVITIAETETKIPLVTDEIQPDIAILDTSLVMSVPPKITADTGMDVLTHVIEAYVSTNANPIVDALCEKVVKIVFNYLEIAYVDGSNKEAREQMHIASCMAGMAFNVASLGLNHGIAHAAGARLHVPHGRMNAILLPEVVAFNSGLENGQAHQTETAKRYMALANCLGQNQTTNPRLGVQNLIRQIKQLRSKLKMPSTFIEYGLSSQEVKNHAEAIATAALSDGCTKTNPRVPTQDDVLKILATIS